MKPSFMHGLRKRTEALVDRCAAWIQRRRLGRAEALVPKAARERAAFWRARYLARNDRLQRERETRQRARMSSRGDSPPAREISRADVLAAIARSRAHREARLKARQDQR